MASALVQFRVEENSRTEAIVICEKLGIDLQTYLRICLSRLVQEKGIPFSMKLKDNNDNPGIAAMREISRIATQNGISDMTLEEINAEISAVRNG